MKHQGLSIHRLNSNPAEKAFAEEWEEANKVSTPGRPYSTLDHLMDPNHQRDPAPSTPQEITSAATVVQWLGSPVGQGFLSRVIEKSPELRSYLKPIFEKKKKK